MIRYWAVVCGLVFTLNSLPSVAQGRIAIIIDDIGYNDAQSQRAARLKGNFTLAILPFTPHGPQAAKIALANQKELMLHLPMSNQHHFPLGKGGLTENLSKQDFARIIQEDLAQIPQVKGINNHMGSQLTQNAQAMSWVMETAALHQLYFVDSRTTPLTKAYDAAAQAGIAHLKRDVFLDDEDSPKAIAAALDKAILTAQQKGMAVAIGHPYENTLNILEQIQPKLDKAGVTLVKASALAYRSTKAIATSQNKTEPQPIKNPLASLKELTKSPNYCPAPLPVAQNVLSWFIDSDAKNVNMLTLSEY